MSDEERSRHAEDGRDGPWALLTIVSLLVPSVAVLLLMNRPLHSPWSTSPGFIVAVFAIPAAGGAMHGFRGGLTALSRVGRATIGAVVGPLIAGQFVLMVNIAGCCAGVSLPR